MAEAVDMAAGADAVIIVAGTTAEWESEGFDRPDMDLPRNQDDLITHVAAANRNTVVAVNTGAPVSMSWAGDVRAVAQIWYGGQEMANALADVLLGVSEPGGRLPTTIPLRVEHNPSYGNFPGEYDEVRYGEGLLVGYRWYETRHLPVLFPFGHGLSYTSFTIGEPRPSDVTFTPGGQLTIDVPVENIGDRAGTEVVQCYVAPSSSRVTRPVKELKAFVKVRLDRGERSVATLTLDDRSFAYWDPGSGRRAELRGRMPFANMSAKADPRPGGWRVDPGQYTLHIGHSSADIAHEVPIEVVTPQS
jgi:beta-glucosidase